MTRYYAGTTREIREGDIVIGRGVVDGYPVDGMRGRVIDNLPCGSEYVACVDFTMSNGRSRWWVGLSNLVPADGVPMEDGKKFCYCCGRVIDNNSRGRLGVRLYKRGDKCENCIAEEIGQVHGYHFAKNLAYNITRDKITFGAEIEIDSPRRDWDEDGIDRDAFVDECVEYARANNYPLIMSYENDGSLNEDGVECVTCPLTVDEWKSDEVKKQIRYLLDNADEYGFDFKPENNAGLHIHVGRKDLCGSDRAVSDAVGLLMGWACTRLWDAGLSDLVGRESNSYCRPLNEGYYGDKREPAGLRDTIACDDRYTFVNIQNASTLELRIFNRATCYEDVAVALDVCYMLGKWATKKINAFLKRNSYAARSKEFCDALEYADRVTWASLVKFSKFPEITLPRMRSVGINV